MKRFMKMAVAMMAETAGFIAALYVMLWITGVMYYNDIIMQRSTLDSVTNVSSGVMLGCYIFGIIFTVIKTVKRCVYEE